MEERGARTDRRALRADRRARVREEPLTSRVHEGRIVRRGQLHQLKTTARRDLHHRSSDGDRVNEVAARRELHDKALGQAIARNERRAIGIQNIERNRAASSRNTTNEIEGGELRHLGRNRRVVVKATRARRPRTERDEAAARAQFIEPLRDEAARLNALYEQGRRERIPIDQIPDVVKEATIAVEDDDFYTNPGFDPSSNLRAVRDYLREGRVVSGASTITQQLVRNVFFDPEYRAEQSIQRKLEEIALAAVLTQRYEKDYILELYLNEIYYGNLAYGIEAAARTYFGKRASELEVHEAALLAGLPQSPAELNPLNPSPQVQTRVIARQHLVLDLMVEEGYLTPSEAEAAKQASLNYVSPDVPLEAPHFTLYAQQELEALLTRLGYPPEFIREGGLRVYTSIDLQFQEIAQQAARRVVSQLRDAHNLTNAAVVVIHPPSGEILAMVGSVDYNDESIDGQVNVAVSVRQPGSTMKAFTYAAALEQGWDASTIIWDVKHTFGIPGQPPYIPQNYDDRFHGPVRVRDALANSYNIPAVLTQRYIGTEYFLNYMRRMGVESLGTDPSRFGLSLTLGGGDVTLLEMTNAYGNL
ncbi:MAG: hypothetical protein HC927_14080, partial [Deltaproteobacteria bacterium]|nr:hypothetical protein [Deltaproteobacteria bacterium]